MNARQTVDPVIRSAPTQSVHTAAVAIRDTPWHQMNKTVSRMTAVLHVLMTVHQTLTVTGFPQFVIK